MNDLTAFQGLAAFILMHESREHSTEKRSLEQVELHWRR